MDKEIKEIDDRIEELMELQKLYSRLKRIQVFIEDKKEAVACSCHILKELEATVKQVEGLEASETILGNLKEVLAEVKEYSKEIAEITTEMEAVAPQVCELCGQDLM